MVPASSESLGIVSVLTVIRVQHAKRKRMLADRYANTNIVRQPSLDGISERAARFIHRCTETRNGFADLFVSTSRSQTPFNTDDSMLDL